MKKLLLLPLAALMLTACSDDEGDETPLPLTLSFNNVESSILAGPTSYGENLYDGYTDANPTRFKEVTISYNDSVAITTGINPGEATSWSAGNDYNFWNGGVVFSTWNDVTSTGWGDYTNQCSSYPSNNGDTFAVIYQSSSNPNPSITFTNGKAYTIGSAQVANTAYGYSVMANGNAYASSLVSTQGWFKVQAWGFDANGNATNGGNPVEFTLADCSESGIGVLSTWASWDLSALGKVNSVQFSFEGSDVGAYGLNTPAYCALRSLTLVW